MQIELKLRTLIDVFNESLAKIKFLDKKCLEIIRSDHEESLSFEQLKARARDFAVWLIRSRDIRIADKVAILGKNCADWDVALWGVILAGAIPVLIDPERPVEGVINHLTHTDSRLIVMADDYQDAESRQELKDFTASHGMAFIEMTVYEKAGLGDNEVDELLNKIPAGIDTDDTAVVLCTSGTTGDPREVELTHRNLIANLQGSVQKVKISHKDTLGHILPPHHSFGLTVGKPINTISVKIVNEDNRELPPGEKGEIALGGPCIMKGYYKNPKATEAVIKTDEEGIRWLHTGDLGHLDEDGNLYITGRKKYVIVLPGGKNVSPEHVETTLSEAKFVGEILVVPCLRKDPAGIVEETIRAIVRPAWEAIETHANHSSDDLVDKPQVLKNLIWRNINECQQNSRQLSSFEKISSQHLEIRIEEFQKTSTGKIMREVYMKL